MWRKRGQYKGLNGHCTGLDNLGNMTFIEKLQMKLKQYLLALCNWCFAKDRVRSDAVQHAVFTIQSFSILVIL